jgi:hypothetical protein
MCTLLTLGLSLIAFFKHRPQKATTFPTTSERPAGSAAPPTRAR